MTTATLSPERTLDDIWEAYKLSRQANRKAAHTITLDEYGFWALRAMGIERLSELTLERIDEFKIERLYCVCGRTVNLQLSRARALARFALQRGLAPRSAILDVSRVCEDSEFEGRAFSLQEAHSLLRTVREMDQGEMWWDLFALYLCTGMRRCEALWLEWAECLDGGLIKLRKGRTKARVGRLVYAGGRMVRLLARRKANANGSKYVFVNPKTGTRLAATSVRNKLQRCAKRAGWRDLGGVTPQAFRRSFTTIALAAGVREADIAKLAGHKICGEPWAITAERYIKQRPERLRDEVSRIEELILGKGC